MGGCLYTDVGSGSWQAQQSLPSSASTLASLQMLSEYFPSGSQCSSQGCVVTALWEAAAQSVHGSFRAQDVALSPLAAHGVFALRR